MSKLETLITQLEHLSRDKSTLLSNFFFITSMPRLITCLKEMNEMIGLETFKNLIVQQFKYFTRNAKETGSPLKGDMMNAIFFGPPGVGKTECGRHLAKFWECCGCIKKESSKTSNKSIVMKILDPPSSDDFILPGFIPTSPGYKETFRTMELPPYFGSSITLPSKKETVPFNVYTRADFIGAYQGSSALKTNKLIQNSIGGVIMIDEAYSLILDDKDVYGKEASTEILKFMSENPDKIRWIFAGYKKEILQGLFSIQPGFERRFNWIIEIDPYTCKDLTSIFVKQMKARDWEYTDSLESLRTVFESNKDLLSHYGGSTLKICYCLESLKTDESWELMLDNKEWTNRSYGIRDVEKALLQYKNTSIKADKQDYPYHLYA